MQEVDEDDATIEKLADKTFSFRITIKKPPLPYRGPLKFDIDLFG